jgi:tetratricopeptide (TPR) repeat protein
MFVAGLLVMMLALVPVDPAPASRVEAMEHVRQGQRLLAAESYQRAADEFRIAIDLDERLFSAHYGLGQAQMGLRDYAEAVKAYQAARRVFEEDRATTAASRLEADQARDDQIRALRDAIREAQSNQPTGGISGRAIRQASIVSHMEMQIQALERMRSARTSTEPPAALSLALGSAFFRNNQLSDAEREYRAAVKADPKLGEARNNLAVVLLLTGRAGEASSEVKQAEKSGFKVQAQLKKDIEAATGKP